MMDINCGPLVIRRFERLYLVAAAVFCLTCGAHGQIEVDVGSTTPGSADQATTATDGEEGTDSSGGLIQDAEADEAARRIVPAPGTQMQSTEEGTLGSAGGTVAAAPSLQLDENEVVLQDGETTEALAVASGAELLRLLGLQLNRERGAGPSELDETTATALFDVGAVRRLKGAEPTVVYRVVVDETPLPDPMIVPWIRQAKLLQERFDRAVQLLGQNRVEAGRQELIAIVTDFPDTDYAKQAQALLAKLDDLSQPVAGPSAQVDDEPEIRVELSPNVSIGTVVVDPQDSSNNRAMIGGRGYKVGDSINAVSNHRVVGITDSVVQIEVEQSGVKKIFDVPVRPTGATQ